MKICIIGTVGIPASYGGFETLVESLVEDEATKFYVYCSSKHYPHKIKTYKGAKLIYIPIKANGASSILYDISSLIHALYHGHTNFLVLGVSGAIFFPVMRLFSRLRIITNIDGIEWKRQKWSGLAEIFLRFSEYLAVNFSDIVISDNESITTYVTERYGVKCETIAYGGDHAFKVEPILKNHDESFAKPKNPFALSICRIEPENNIELILDAFRYSEIELVFIGNWHSSSYGKNLYSKFKNDRNIHLVLPIYCLNTLYFYRSSCDVYIHGHSAGGTNPSLVEMMHFSKPIIAYNCLFNKSTMENRGDYFSNAEDLLKLIKNLAKLADPKHISEIAKRRYTWDTVRSQYLQLFKN